MTFRIPLELKRMLRDELASRDAKRKKQMELDDRLQAMKEENASSNQDISYANSRRADLLQERTFADKDKAMRMANIDAMGRNNDAFEVAAGRQSPELFNMRYGGGAAGGGYSQGQTKSGSADPNAIDAKSMAKLRLDAMADYNSAEKTVGADGKPQSFDDYFNSIVPPQQAQGTDQPMSQQDYFRNERAKTDAINLLNENQFGENVYQSQGQGGAPYFSMDKTMGATQGLDVYNQKKMERNNYLTSFDGMPESQRTINMEPPVINPIRQALEWDKPGMQPVPAAQPATSQSIVTPANRTGLVTDNDKGFLETPILESISNLHGKVKRRKELGEEKRRKGIY